MKRAVAIIIAVLLVAPLAPTATARRLLAADAIQNACDDQCQAGYDQNVNRCVLDTDSGQAPAISPVKGGLNLAPSYVAPTEDVAKLVVDKCRALQEPELKACRAACHPIMSAVKEYAKNKAADWWEKMTGGAGGGGANGGKPIPPAVAPAEGCAAKCDETFGAGKMMATWCKQKC